MWYLGFKIVMWGWCLDCLCPSGRASEKCAWSLKKHDTLVMCHLIAIGILDDWILFSTNIYSGALYLVFSMGMGSFYSVNKYKIGLCNCASITLGQKIITQPQDS